MCGRFTISVTMDELFAYYSLHEPGVPFHEPRFNIAPMQMVPAIINDGERNKIGELRWGLVPAWSKDDKGGFKMINARAETLTEKPSFRGLLTKKRCLIPADGFYEWKAVGSAKQPYRIVLRERSIFSLAGLYETWTSPDGNKISTCTIITTEPNELMADIHDRMPVILSREDESTWLDRTNQDKDVLQSLLRPYDAAEMRAYLVSTAVGNVRNKSAELIKEVTV